MASGSFNLSCGTGLMGVPDADQRDGDDGQDDRAFKLGGWALSMPGGHD
jgi:hypothetical protein